MVNLGPAIKDARLKKRLSQEALAAQFDISKAAVSKWESGKTVPDQRKLARLIQILDLDPAVAAGLPPKQFAEAASPAPEPPPPRVLMTLGHAPEGRPDVPVWASAQAGDEGAMILTPDPVDFVHRPAHMRGVRNPFAFLVVGSSMSPALEPGDTVIINPALHPRPNVDCVFIQEQPDGTYLALVKRLLRQTADAWRVRQFEARRDFDLPRRKWPRAHVISDIRRGGL